MGFKYVTRGDDTIQVEVPLVFTSRSERNMLIKEPQNVFATGLLACAYGLNTLKYGHHNEAFLLGKLVKDPHELVTILHKYIMDKEILNDAQLLDIVFSAMCGYANNDELMRHLFNTKMMRHLTGVRNALFLKVLVAIPRKAYNPDNNVTVYIDDLSMHILRPLNYHINSSMELWQAVVYVTKAGLLVKTMLNRSKLSHIKLRLLLVSLLHISQLTLSRIGK
jgi:hypothetical protein